MPSADHIPAPMHRNIAVRQMEDENHTFSTDMTWTSSGCLSVHCTIVCTARVTAQAIDQAVG
jgi:hypothetical protein